MCEQIGLYRKTFVYTTALCCGTRWQGGKIEDYRALKKCLRFKRCRMKELTAVGCTVGCCCGR